MDHPITAWSKLVRQWLDNDDFPYVTGTTELLTITKDRLNSVISQAVREGADQMLQACCDAIYKYEGEPLCGGTAEWLRAAMRPKPPSLKIRIAEAIAKGDKHQALYLLDEALSDD